MHFTKTFLFAAIASVVSAAAVPQPQSEAPALEVREAVAEAEVASDLEKRGGIFPGGAECRINVQAYYTSDYGKTGQSYSTSKAWISDHKSGRVYKDFFNINTDGVWTGYQLPDTRWLELNVKRRALSLYDFESAFYRIQGKGQKNMKGDSYCWKSDSSTNPLGMYNVYSCSVMCDEFNW
jgi:hypothetical protein